MNTVKTPKGTVLPLLNLKGKDYLQVAYRLVWFREEHPDWAIETLRIEGSADYSIFTAIIKDASGRVMATAHKSETSQGFADHLEKAETGAIGRALALCGYGTQFTDDLDEGDRLADSPITRSNPGQKAAAVTPKVNSVTRVGTSVVGRGQSS